MDRVEMTDLRGWSLGVFGSNFWLRFCNADTGGKNLTLGRGKGILERSHYNDFLSQEVSDASRFDFPCVHVECTGGVTRTFADFLGVDSSLGASAFDHYTVGIFEQPSDNLYL